MTNSVPNTNPAISGATTTILTSAFGYNFFHVFINIGTNSIVLPGSTLREGVLLTAGSLLIGDTEAWGVYKGNPAILIKKINPKKYLIII